MKYLLLVHVDGAEMARQTREESRRLGRDSLEYDRELERSGHYITSSALADPKEAVIVRRSGDGYATTDGPFAEVKEHLGEVILHADQDRSLWNRAQIEEGETLVRRALSMQRPGPYALQAAIAALHAADETDWTEIVALYDLLLQVAQSPVTALNRAVALGFASGFDAGLAAIDAVLPELGRYQPAHAARADFLRRLGRLDEAAVAYRHALELTTSETDKRFLENRLRESLHA